MSTASPINDLPGTMATQGPATTGPSEPAPRRRTRRSLRRRVLTVVAGSYLGWCAVIFFAQGPLLFPRSLTGPAMVSPPGGAEQLWLTAPDGVKVEGLFFAAPGRGAEPGLTPGPAVIFTHGNAELIHHCADLARVYTEMGVSVLIPEYRGYGNSGGAPSQAGILGDTIRFYDWLAARPEVDPAAIILHGRSLGGGVAAQLASERRPAALILESTFTSIASFSWRYGVPPVLARHPYRTDRVVRGLGDVPIMIIHGRADTIVPVEHGRGLHALAPHAKYYETPDGHLDLPRDAAAYRAAIWGFLADHGLAAVGAGGD